MLTRAEEELDADLSAGGTALVRLDAAHLARTETGARHVVEGKQDRSESLVQRDERIEARGGAGRRERGAGGGDLAVKCRDQLGFKLRYRAIRCAYSDS